MQEPDPKRTSTRFKDLIDLVALTDHTSPTAAAQRSALYSEAKRRGGYAAEAGRSHLPTARTLDEALEYVRQFVDPLLRGRTAGRWDPETRRWS